MSTIASSHKAWWEELATPTARFLGQTPDPGMKGRLSAKTPWRESCSCSQRAGRPTVTGKEQVQLVLSRCFSTKTEPIPVLTLPPLVVPVYHASVSGALPCTVVLYSSAMVRPVTSAPWKKTSLIWIAPISASQTSHSSRCSQPHPFRQWRLWEKGLALVLCCSKSSKAACAVASVQGHGACTHLIPKTRVLSLSAVCKACTGTVGCGTQTWVEEAAPGPRSSSCQSRIRPIRHGSPARGALVLRGVPGNAGC